MGKTERIDSSSAVQVAPTLNSGAPEPASEGNAMDGQFVARGPFGACSISPSKRSLAWRKLHAVLCRK